MRKRLLAAMAVLLVLAGLLTLGMGEALSKPAGVPAAVSVRENGSELRLTAIRNQKTQAPTAEPSAKPTAVPTATPTPVPTGAPTPVPEGPIIDPRSIADYIFAHGELPGNFLTKQEARALGWDSTVNYVSDVVPGMSIGGDRFGNYEERLPVVWGREYYEADCWYVEGPRSAERIIYSDDGHVWYTEDHYNTFTELFPTGFREGESTP